MKTLYLLFASIFILTNSISAQLALDSGLVAYYPLDSVAIDYSTFNIQGTILGAIPDSGKNDIPYSAFYFDGMNQYIDCSDNERDITNKVSVSAWINKTTDLDCHIVNKYRGSNGTIQQGFHLATKDGFPYFGGRLGQSGSEGYYYILADESHIMDGYWHHLLGTVDGNEWNFWVDGYHIGTLTGNSSNPSLICPEILAIGYYPEMQHGYFDGKIDEVRLYNRVLNIEEINLLADISFIDSTYIDTTINDTTSIVINETNLNKEITIYPNPGNDKVNIITPYINQSFTYLVLNIYGKEIIREERCNAINEVNTRDLPTGIYIFKFIINGNISKSIKWIKL